MFNLTEVSIKLEWYKVKIVYIQQLLYLYSLVNTNYKETRIQAIVFRIQIQINPHFKKNAFIFFLSLINKINTKKTFFTFFIKKNEKFETLSRHMF